MQHDDWRAWRAGGLGASEVACVLGISPFGSPWSVFALKTGITPDDEIDSRAFRIGHLLEDDAAELFHEETELHVVGEQTWCTHQTEPWLRATPDGLVAESAESSIADALGVFEVKTSRDSAKQWEESIPNHYQAQVQAQLAVTGMPRAWLGVWHPFYDFRVYTLERNEADIALIVDRCRTFWHDHVLTGTPPPADGHPATTEALRHIEGEPGAVREMTVDDVFNLSGLGRLKRQAKELEAEIDAAENAIKAFLGEATEGMYGERALVTWRPQTSSRIDTKALREAEPEIAEKFTTTTTSRVLRLAKPKGETSS